LKFGRWWDVQDFRNLKVWEKAHSLTLSVYKRTGNFPQHELYGLRSQIRRSSSSVPMNIAEGCGRGSPADFLRFLQIAMGSACELEYQLLLGRDLEYLPPDDYNPLTEGVVEVKRMLAALIQTVRADS
jgi:four helix bundle protein